VKGPKIYVVIDRNNDRALRSWHFDEREAEAVAAALNAGKTWDVHTVEEVPSPDPVEERHRW